MTTMVKAQHDKKDSMEEKPKKNIVPSLGDKFLGRFFKQPKEITVRTWIIGNNTEAMVDEKTVKLGVQDVYIGNKKYTIFYDAIQNIHGKLIYNTKYNVANGALRYRLSVDKEIDAKIRRDMASRENLTAIWSKWQLPLMVALVAIIGCIIAFSFLAIIGGQLSTANNCLGNEQCMLNKITAIRAQQEAERLKAEAQANAR